MAIPTTSKPPYYAVIFTSQHTGKEKEEYDKSSAINKGVKEYGKI
ncbi:MAG: hypothetical protein QF842_00555 [Candidatus Marinimicrobia bacterium]|jgi:hypothetical protein|nr:hypothetical protein [Candidatus Neomarinimicrobiota bacterium]MDP6611574.1 hypothetical protein [Candidatus Neomarinimicrobiota bacterium]|tara:strand:+ start:195 stop:329 length:135 start_codon:yes stop_codon:yes gene_type:complete